MTNYLHFGENPHPIWFSSHKEIWIFLYRYVMGPFHPSFVHKYINKPFKSSVEFSVHCVV